MFTKESMRPKKSTLIQLFQSHRKDAKLAQDKFKKRLHWELAFDYLNEIRTYYGAES